MQGGKRIGTEWGKAVKRYNGIDTGRDTGGTVSDRTEMGKG